MAKQWYIVHTYSGYENKVRESLRSGPRPWGWWRASGDPDPDRGRGRDAGRGEVILEEEILPRYVLINHGADRHHWHVVKNTPKVTGFVGSV